MKLDEICNLIPYSEAFRILHQEGAELDGEFMGFTNTYKHLAEIIPKSHTVIDLGCNLAPQCYYFKDHAGYIGIDTIDLERFHTPNTTHYKMNIQDFVRDPRYKHWVTDTKVFAILNYVPGPAPLDVVKQFNNIYCFYPSAD